MLIAHSPSTKYYAEIIKEQKGGILYEVTGPPTIETLKILTIEKEIIAVGGGAVIDTAKIIAIHSKAKVYAIPTTASGAAMTPWATIWNTEKISIPTQIPELRNDYYGMSKFLPEKVRLSTQYDCLSHVVESWWSKNATLESKKYCATAMEFMQDYAEEGNLNDLIDAGNEAGKAIAITQTNIIHALSYGLTIKYGLDHGSACGVFFWPIVKQMNYLWWLPKIKPIEFEYDAEWAISEALNYKKAEGYLTREELDDILS